MGRYGSLTVAIVVSLSACASKAEQERASKSDYAASSAEMCRKARDNASMVKNISSAMGKTKPSHDLEHMADTMCEIADKAARDAAVR